jgi:hypothetical protein
MNAESVERRAFRRRRTGEHGIIAARVRPGQPAAIVDVSPGGALLDVERRLLPGTTVDLQVQTTDRHLAVRGRVLRCAVARLFPSVVLYRAAIAFDSTQRDPFHDEPAGYAVPLPCPPDQNERGVRSTPQAV